jgi:hypothetical protein
MKKHFKQIFVGLSFFFAFLSTQAQNSNPPLPPPEETGPPEIDRQTIKNIKNSYPLVVTEIITNEGDTLRGRLEGTGFDDNQDVYFISNRSKKNQPIIKTNTIEIAWVLPDRREHNTYFDLGILNMPFSRVMNSQNMGLDLGLGVEFSNNKVILANFFGLFGQDTENDLPAFFGGFNGQFGYRINRTEKNIHTIGGGMGAISERIEDSSLNFSLSGMYEFDLQLNNFSGLAISSTFHYLPASGNTHFILGIKYRLNASFPFQMFKPSPADIY